MEEQLANDPQEARDLYMHDTAEYVEYLAKRNTTKLEKLVAADIDKIRRNYKLIELSSRTVSPHAVQLTLKKLTEVMPPPSKKGALHDFHTVFPGSPNIEFIFNTLFKSCYNCIKCFLKEYIKPRHILHRICTNSS